MAEAQPAPASATRKPMYEDHHSCASCLMARVRNQHHLNSLSSASQFKWLHRFYLVVDRVVEQHRVYKLYGGPHGFMVSTNVAESDPDHATTLYRFVRHLMVNLQHLHLPGGHAVDIAMALSSGEMASGLLGTTSLTYQLVGRPVALANELVTIQPELKLMITSEFFDCLEDSEAVSSDLRLVGHYKPTTTGGEVAVYTLAGHEHERLYNLSDLAELQLQKSGPVPLPETRLPCPPTPPPVDTLDSPGCLSSKEGPKKQAAAAAAAETVSQEEDDEGKKDSSADDIPGADSYRKDIFLCYEDSHVEERYLSHQSQLDSDAMWTVFGILISLVYFVAARAHGSREGSWQMLAMQLVPALMLRLRHGNPAFYLKHRDDAWCLHRLILTAICSWPGSFTYTTSAARAALSYGMWAMLYDVLGRRLRFRVQLASCVFLHGCWLLLMGVHRVGTAAYEKVGADYLALHFAMMVLVPCVASYAWDYHSRLAFEAGEQGDWDGQGSNHKAGNPSNHRKAD